MCGNFFVIVVDILRTWMSTATIQSPYSVYLQNVIECIKEDHAIGRNANFELAIGILRNQLERSVDNTSVRFALVAALAESNISTQSVQEQQSNGTEAAGRIAKI